MRQLVERLIQMYEVPELWAVVERRYAIAFRIFPPRGLVNFETLWSSECQLTPCSPETPSLPRGEVAYAAAAKLTSEWQKIVLDRLMAGLRRFAVSNDPSDKQGDSVPSPAPASSVPATLPDAGPETIQNPMSHSTHSNTSPPRHTPDWQHRRWPQLHPHASVVPAGKQPRLGVDYGCGNATCQDCYEDDWQTAKTLLLAEDTTGPHFDGDLAGFAAGDAARTLVQNWAAALRDGYQLEALLLDVDETVAKLRHFKMVLAQTYGFSQP